MIVMVINEKHSAIASSVDNKFRIRVRQVQANYRSYTVVTVFWFSSIRIQMYENSMDGYFIHYENRNLNRIPLVSWKLIFH